MSFADSNYVPMFEIPSERMRGVGCLYAERHSQRVILPLADVRVSARVAEQVSSVLMTQTFQNPYSEHLEAVYIFPLPGGAAVSDFEMKVGSRIVRGKVEERGEARRQYQQAINEGKRAALMEKERDDVFTVQVGNLPPGEEITIKITYSERLPFFEDGTTEMRLPLVVAPRYIPGQSLWRDPVGDGIEPDTNLVPDASRISPPRLAKSFDPKVSLGIEVTILWEQSSEDTDIQNLCCSQHATRTSAGREGVKVALARHDEALDRDFVLRWTVSGAKMRPSLLVYRDPYGESFGMLSLTPPYNEGHYTQARDIVFVVDRSGSMQGIKMASAARACALLLNTLGPHDRFAIQSFNNGVEWFNPTSYYYGKDGYFMPSDYYGIEQGERHLRNISAGGGTEIHRALVAAMSALEQRRDAYRRVPVIVLLTDGEIGNEAQVLKEAQQRLGTTRLFTVGIDTAVNQGFLQHLAKVGNGTATFVTPGAQLEDALVSVGREIGSPLVVDIRLQDVDSGLELSSIAPSKIPDLFQGRATTTFFAARGLGRIRVRGRFTTGGELDIVVNPREVPLLAIPQLWAKTRITDLEDRYRVELSTQEQIKREIINLSVRFNILTRFTAFIAVDHSEIVNYQGYQRHVVQPVETPTAWQQPTAGMPLPASMPMPACAPPPPPAYDQSYNAPVTSSGFVNHSVPKERASTPTTGRSIAYTPSKEEVLRAIGQPTVSESKPKSSQKSAQVESRPQVPQQPPANIPAGKKVDVSKPEPSFVEKAVDIIKGALRDNSQANQANDSNYSPITYPPYIRPSSDRELIEQAILAFQEAYRDVYNGYCPSPDRFDQIRRDVIELLLRDSNLRNYLPKLFRFFDIEAHDLIGGLKRRTPRPIFDQHRYFFDDVVKEVKNYFATGVKPPSRKDGSFWDSSI